jgi:ABC-2 type transport system permease protein
MSATPHAGPAGQAAGGQMMAGGQPSSPPDAEPGSPGSKAVIYDRGYRLYDGPRTGIWGAQRSLIRHSLRRAVGLGRPTRYKLVPLAIVVMAYLPASVFVGAAALIPIDTDPFLPSYAEYYGFVIATIYLLAGFVAPELLCPDRRSGLLGVYLASPLDRASYLVGKAISVLLMLLLVTLGPPLLMLIAFSLQNMGPDGFVEWMRVLARIMVSSLVFGTLYMVVALAVSATTDRGAVATAAILALIPGSGIVTELMTSEADLSPHFRLANLLVLPRAMVFRIHDEIGSWPRSANPTWTLWLAWAAWTAASIAWIWFRYRRLLVRR